MEKRKVRVQIVGNYLSDLVKPLREKGIVTESIIEQCNPLAMVGTPNHKYEKYAEDPKMIMQEVLNIRKNLSQMLSRNTDNFCTNYNTLPTWAEVRDHNSSEYFIYSNSSMAYPILERNGEVYSRIWTNDAFMDDIMSDKTFVIRLFPYSKDFNWKYYFDRFIAEVQKVYDRNHIILIKTNSSQWYMDEQNIMSYDNTSSEFRSLIEEMDRYFVDKTHCLIVEFPFNCIPGIKGGGVFPFAHIGTNGKNKIASEIENIIYNDPAAYMSVIPKYTNELARSLVNKLSGDALRKGKETIERIEDEWLNFNDIDDLGNNDVFIAHIKKLKLFLDPDNGYTLSDYVIKALASGEAFDTSIDFELIELYTRYLKLNINDIIAFYMICINCENRSELKDAAQNIVSNADCLPVTAVKKICAENVAFLSRYPYLNDEFKGKDESEKVFVPLENNCYIVFDLTTEDYIKKVDFPNPGEFDYAKVINNGYICPITFADALTYSYEYYAEKARRGDGAKPSYLKFSSENDFYESLKYIDYKPLLESDNFIFSIGDTEPPLEGFFPQVDFTELVDPNTAIINVRNGLGDQICHFIMGQIISARTGREVIYLDLPYLQYIGQFNGSDFKMITRHPVKAFSKIVSPRLKQAYNLNDYCAISFLRRINDYNLITSNVYYYHRATQKQLKSSSISGTFICDDIVKFVNTALPYSYYFNLIRIEELKSIFDYKLSDYIEFPPFEKQPDIEMGEKMMACDAVILHIRRGDRVALGWNEDISFFPEAVAKIMKLAQYENKKFFCFSDDINWCRNHRAEIGLDLVGECEVCFVEGHKGEECFRDVQLMALGKMIVFGRSGFPRIAAMYSERWEMLFCAEKKTDDFFHKYVRKNKYETEPFSRSDYSHSQAPNK